jgi:hypothetical protein
MNDIKKERIWLKAIKDVGSFMIIWVLAMLVMYSTVNTVVDAFVSIRSTARQAADHEKRLATLEEQSRRASATAHLDQNKPVDIAQRP